MTNSPPIVAAVTAVPVGVPSGAPPLPPSPDAVASSGATAPGVLAPPRPATFEQLAALPDESIDVPTGAALIARDAYGTLDVDRLLARLDELAAPLEGRDLASLALEEQADAVTAHVFGTLGFRGNEQDYYDPKNSLLPDVLDRKLGIPITLALVYCAVARRLGVRARGVSFPGHFLVRVDGPAATPASAAGMLDALAAGDLASGDAGGASAPVIVDPFFGGRRLDDAGLAKLLERSTPSGRVRPNAHGKVQATPAPTPTQMAEHLAPAMPRAMLVRMLINLKWIYATRGDFARALLALDRIISLQPDSVPALRERGMLAAKLGSVESARADLARLLELVPQVPDAKSLRERLDELRAKKSVLN